MKVFFAYPAKPAYLSEIIGQAVREAAFAGVDVHTWEENDICGRPLLEPILEHIIESDFVVADITKLNFNVTFEIGYAIARGKRVYLVRSKATPVDSMLQEAGMFDTLGYKTYDDYNQLTGILISASPNSPLPNEYSLDRRSPIYLVLPRHVDDIVAALHARIKKTGYSFRTFNSQEDSRLPAAEAIEQTLSSFGVALTLLTVREREDEVHNLRSAFVAGLAIGADIPLLVVQPYGGPVPTDVRDFTVDVKYPSELRDHVHDLAVQVTNRTQEFEGRPPPNLTALAKLNLGDPMAENELDTISEYFLQTDQYLRAERGEVRLVVGRKGTGKTAIFGHLAERRSRDTRNVVLDLKPEGYQLVKLRDRLLINLDHGSKYHLLVAFWEMILYLELCNRILVLDERRHLTDHNLFEPYNRLKARYLPYLSSRETDFSERLASVSDAVIKAFQELYGPGERDVTLSSGELTNVLYQTDIRTIREDIKSYMSTKHAASILFDNLDRGWPETGLKPDDVLVIKSLIEASSKIQKDMRSKNVDFNTIIFLRNDVYQILMKSTPDFGKDMRAQLDWTDSDQIREMIRLRLANAMDEPSVTFDAAWHQIAASHIYGEESFQYLVDRSLFRPRNILKLIYHCRASAINSRKDIIDEDDIEKGVNSFSQDVLIEADRELTDVMPEAKGLIYFFMGEKNLLSKGELLNLLKEPAGAGANLDLAIERLLYFGFLGVERGGIVRYIYDVGYNLQLIQTEILKFGSEMRYSINPAFWPALYVEPTHH